MKKVLILSKTIHPSKVSFFNALNKYFNEKIKLNVVFTSENESIRKRNIKKEKAKINFNYIILKSKQISINSKKDKHFFHFNFNIKNILNKENPDIVIHIWWAWLSAWSSLYWCKKHKKKYILWSESTKYETSWRRTITKPIVKYLVKQADKYISLWTRSKEYLELLWAKNKDIFQLINTINTDYFLKQSKILSTKKKTIKKKYWIKTKYVLIYVWQLIKRKWVYEILNWFGKFQMTNKDFSLMIVWSWLEKENIDKLIIKKNIKNVIFPWFIQQDKISELYTLSDIFTLPSSEEVRWLVINEAMCFWLPILTADKVWASVDLVEDGKNGYIMKNNTSEEFIKWLNHIINNWLIEKNNSIEIINRMKINTFLDSLKF